MRRTNENFDIQLRLTEINRMAIQLCVTSSELADLAAQLNYLSKLNERIRIFAYRRTCANRRRSNGYLSRNQANSRNKVSLRRNLADER